MRRTLLAFSLLCAIAALGVWTYRGRVGLWLTERTIARSMETSLLDELPDGLHVALCGAGAPLADPLRSGPCTAVIAGRDLYVVDAGSGAARSLARLRIPAGRVTAILLTHYHSDHIDGLGELLLQRWANGAQETPTPVYGPQGVGEVVAGFNRAYALDASYRVAHHGPGVMPPTGAGAVAHPFESPVPGVDAVLLETETLRITAFAVDHRC